MTGRRTASLLGTGSGRRRGRPALFGTALALLALASIAVSPYFCRAFAAPASDGLPGAAAEAPAGESGGSGVSLAELLALFGSEPAYCGTAAGDAEGEGGAPPEVFCLACQLAAAGAPLLTEPPALPAPPPAAPPAFALPGDRAARASWSPRDGPTRAPPRLL